MKLAIVVLLLGALFTRTASAHGERTSHAVITVASDTEATITLDDASLEMTTDEGCSLEPRRGPAMKLRCHGGGVAGAFLAVGGLGHGTDVVIVHVRDDHGSSSAAHESTTVVTASAPRIRLPGREGSTAVAARFARLGFEHVLSGLDHLLLLLALFWSVGPTGPRASVVRALARTTALFTVAHSLSLAVVALGLVHIASAPAEALIALSLVLVAVDPRPGSGSTFAFGLVHGLGFAGGLAEIGLPRASTALALLAFNGGVELAQLVVVGGCLVATTFALPKARGSLDVAARLSSYVVGTIGVQLLLSRGTALLR